MSFPKTFRSEESAFPFATSAVWYTRFLTAKAVRNDKAFGFGMIWENDLGT
ncbi:MAG: hypothetical protein JWN74_2158 [Acidobacteriaceae bacterium]|nr:hypothetical protein [Acidobacteriaceae bacterium]